MRAKRAWPTDQKVRSEGTEPRVWTYRVATSSMVQVPRDPEPGEAFSLPPYVTARLRAERKKSGMSLRALAKAAEVSPSLISQIETGKVNPSVGTLVALATALSIPLDELFSDDGETEADNSQAATFARSGPGSGQSPILKPRDRPSVDLAGGVRWERLTPTSDSKVTFLYVTYGVGGSSSPPDALMQHEGREFGLVLEGRLGAQIGTESYDLGPGDSIVFECSRPHRFWTIGDAPAVVVWTVVAPATS